MKDHDQISLTGKKLPVSDSGHSENLYRAKNWQERLADMSRMRKMVLNDMLGLGKNKKEETENPQIN